MTEANKNEELSVLWLSFLVIAKMQNHEGRMLFLLQLYKQQQKCISRCNVSDIIIVGSAHSIYTRYNKINTTAYKLCTIKLSIMHHVFSNKYPVYKFSIGWKSGIGLYWVSLYLSAVVFTYFFRRKYIAFSYGTTLVYKKTSHHNLFFYVQYKSTIVCQELFQFLEKKCSA